MGISCTAKILKLAVLENKYYWIFGASGFVGRRLAEQLQFKSELVCFGNKRLDLSLLEEFNFIMSPLEDFDYEWFRRFPPKVIFHCARLAGSNPASRLRAARTGAKANQKLVDFIQTLAQPPTVVYCSGTLMYGNQIEPANETAALNPIAYAKQYQIAEAPWLIAQQQGKLDVRFARPAWILGADSWFYHYFLKPALKSGKVPYYGSGLQQMTLLAVEDCAAQLYQCYSKGSANTNYNLYSLAPISQMEFAKKIATHLQLETEGVSQLATAQRFGKTEAAALCSNIPVYSMHTEWKKQHQNKFNTVDAVIAHALTTFENASLIGS